MKNSLNRIVYVNGDYVKEENAVISVFDRGFIFGDGIYEVVPVINGKLVDKQYFLERLERSLAELSIAWPCCKEEYMAVMNQLIIKNNLKEGIVYSQVTRGVADRDFPFPNDTDSSFVAFTSVMNILNSPDIKTGISVITTADLRWKRRDIKSIYLLGQVLAKQDAISKNAIEKAKKRIGENSDKVKWIVCDINEFIPENSFDFWHDRAVFHFLTSKKNISNYAKMVS